jgi:hypothetical protein
MRRRPRALLIALAFAIGAACAALAACNLNPQPLPPLDDQASEGSDGGLGFGDRGSDAAPSSASDGDAGGSDVNGDGGSDASPVPPGDGGPDADAGDASTTDADASDGG